MAENFGREFDLRLRLRCKRYLKGANVDQELIIRIETLSRPGDRAERFCVLKTLDDFRLQEFRQAVAPLLPAKLGPSESFGQTRIFRVSNINKPVGSGRSIARVQAF